MTRNDGGGIFGRGIIEKESSRGEASRRRVGGIWEVSEKHLGGIREAIDSTDLGLSQDVGK